MKMKMKMMFCLLLATIPLAPASANQSDDTSLMRSTDIAYEEAMKFAQLLREHGFTVRSVHRSKMESFFKGLNKAAFIRTDKGVIEVIFFDDPTGAEKVQVLEQWQDERYIYSFQGQPQPNTGDRMNAAYPVYFIAHHNLFMVTNEPELGTALKQAFAR